MKKLLLPLFLISALVAQTARCQQQPDFDPGQAHYLWPTEASHYLTSTFAETRSDHFHAALDLKTWGQRGYEVYATRKGIVDRIAIGPTGYGKVIYLKHPDGSYSVYAHLLKFNDRLQQMADSIRFAQDYQFEIDRYVGWKNIHVEQGELIGYSGASGIGPPHLHFELRTPSDKPFNPLLTNLKVEDTIAPQIMGLSIEPLSTRSSIEGNNAIYKQRVWGKKEHYNFGTVHVSGPVGLGINAFDQTDDVHNSYAVYELSMSVDGRRLFTSRVDSFSYRETGQMFIDRVYSILEQEGAGYQRLYTTDGNSLPFYAKQNGWLNLQPGTHHVTIRATDYFGNTTRASLQLDVQKTAVHHPRTKKQPAADMPIAPPYRWSWFHNWVTLSGDQFNSLTLGTTDTGALIRHKNGIAVMLRELDNLYIDIPQVGPTILRRINPGNWNVIPSADYQDFAVLPSKTVYDTVSVGMAVRHSDTRSITVDMLPEAYPLQGQYSFYVHRPPSLKNTDRLSFYKRDRKDKEWELVPTKFSDRYIIGNAGSLGRFELKQDTTAPELFNPRLTQRPDGRWLVMINVTDALSGIDYGRTTIAVNGVQGIAEFEPEDDRFVYYHPDFDPTASLSSITVDITAYDQMGNRRHEIYQIENQLTKK